MVNNMPELNTQVSVQMV